MSDRRQLARLAAEGVAIIVSILIAFAIDAAWDGHLERQEELEVVAGLEREFAANVDVFQESLILSTEGLSALQRFVLVPPDELALTPREDTWAQIAEPLMRSWRTAPSDGFLDATVSSGKLASIRDSQVRAELARYMGLREDLAQVFATLQRFNEEALLVMGGFPGFQTAAASEDAYAAGLNEATVLALAQDRDLRRLGAAKIPYWGAYVVILGQVLAGAEDVLQLLREAG